MEEEEPVTPMGRLCLLPEHNHIINCAIVLENPIDIDALKQELSNSIMIKIPRFSCIMTADPRDGSEFWKRVHVDLDNHIIIHNNHIDDNNNNSDNEYDGMSDEDVVNSYLADMAISSPMRMDKPLWEIHVLHAQKCMIIRVHHAIADGMSLMSLLWTMGRRSSTRDNNKINNMVTNTNNVISDKKKLLGYANKEGKGWKSMGLWESLVYVWNTLVFGLIFVGRCLWVKDKGVISGFTGVEFWPRKVATAKFKISDMKSIKKAIPNATIHEVLCGIIWCGLTRYLNVQYPKDDLPEGVQITGMCPFNLRQQPGVQDVAKMLTKNTSSPWGNRFSVILLPFTYRKKCMDPLSYVALAKELMAKKKQSMEARLSYNIVSLASALLGSKVAGFFYYNLFCNTSFLLSNIAGPLETISMGENPVTSIKVTSSTQPHAMTMHLVSYLEWANLQIQVAKDVIPDPKALAKYFEDALFDMKEAAERM